VTTIRLLLEVIKKSINSIRRIEVRRILPGVGKLLDSSLGSSLSIDPS